MALTRKTLIGGIFLVGIVIAGMFAYHALNGGGDSLWCEVWSKNSPAGESYEFKVNDFAEYDTLEQGFLYECDAVKVIAPSGETYNLNKDYNINSYSGEITRRWVLYGPDKAALPISGEYTFQFIQGGEIVKENTVDYTQNNIGYPTEVTWERAGDDINVEWTPPSGDKTGIWYKVIIWNVDGPSVFISQQFDDGTISSASMPDMPLYEGSQYSLNVAIYYDGGFAYSEYIILTWE